MAQPPLWLKPGVYCASFVPIPYLDHWGSPVYMLWFAPAELDSYCPEGITIIVLPIGTQYIVISGGKLAILEIPLVVIK